MEFKEVVVKRRSARKFTKDAVPQEALVNVLESGRWAPSAGNCQPWHFVVITDHHTKATIAQNCTRFSKKHWMQFPPERARYLAARGGSWDKSYMKDIPILIVVSYKSQENMRDELVFGSVWMAVENMLLAATDEGLGSCVYTFFNKKEENELRKILHSSQGDRIACIIQLGYTKMEPFSPSRKQISEIVSYEHF
ncbi:MAG: nitroreductase family protein [Candidatus Bathyarchaeota archaeon]|nr:nitroreductase family protein [Candidatus Bathyarchaeota archaeon]